MDLVTTLLAGFGLAAPAGLNAWLPLLIVGMMARFTHVITLKAPFDALTNTWVLLGLSVLLLVEIFADKVPVVDSINDIVHTLIRPTAGGILFAAHSGAVGGLDPTLSFVLGVLSAGSVHAVKATSRPVVTATTGGIGNMFVSMVEDFIAGIATVIALFAPVVSAVIMGTLLVLFILVVTRWRARRRRRRLSEL